jgi:hypothetical protein
MEKTNKAVFIELFRQAYRKCFGIALLTPLSEADSKYLSNVLFEKTGLVVGARSLKNYSSFVLGGEKETKDENPSDATLDTLARYVLDAPYTDEIHRKEKEDYYPYWFQYRSKFSVSGQSCAPSRVNMNKIIPFLLIAAGLIASFSVIKLFVLNDKPEYVNENFGNVSEDSLTAGGWIVKGRDTAWWSKRKEIPGHLVLYTLRGDNWTLGKDMASIRNLLMRKIRSQCFTAEVCLSDFIPSANWQQAGILLSEPPAFTGRMLRMSVSYNDYFGGYKKPAEILIQVVSSLEGGPGNKPEEIAHVPIFSIEPETDSIVRNNLKRTVLKIEKKGDRFRFLYTTTPEESFAFEEAAVRELNIEPHYISLFAIQGWTDSINVIPVYFDSFILKGISCDE